MDIFKDLQDESEKEMRSLKIKELLAMNLEEKVKFAKNRVKFFFEQMILKGKTTITVSFSGGKDSTALLHLVDEVRRENKFDVELKVIYATEITFPETLDFIKGTADKYGYELEIHKPKMPWKQGLEEKGFPVFGKTFSVGVDRLLKSRTKTGRTAWAFGIEDSTHYKIVKKRLFLLDKDITPYEISERCCDVIKGGVKKDKRPSFVGTSVDESQERRKSWLQTGCNIFNDAKPMSKPISIWKEADVWAYLAKNKLTINPIYIIDQNLPFDKRYKDENLRMRRLGCVSCPFGSHMDASKVDRGLLKENRFELLLRINPNLYKSQVWHTGMYRIIADMNVMIKGDDDYLEYFIKRRKEIDNWYKNIDKNLMKVMKDVQNAGRDGWTYTYEEIKKAYRFYDLVEPTKEAFEKVFKNDTK